MKKNTSAKLDDDEIETLVKKYIDRHLPRSVSKVGGSNMSNKPKSENKPKEVNKQQRGSSTRIVNTIKINLTKPRGSGQPRVKKEVDIAKTEQELQELERKDLEYQRANLGFSNPNVFGYNQTDFIEHARNVRRKQQEDDLRNQRTQDEDGYTNEKIREEPPPNQEPPKPEPPPKQEPPPKPEPPPKQESPKEEQTRKTEEKDFYRATSNPQVGRDGLSVFTQPINYDPNLIPSDFAQRLSEQGYTEPEILNAVAREIIAKRDTTPKIAKMDERPTTKAGTERKPRGRPQGSKGKPKPQQVEEDIIPEPSEPTPVEKERKARGRPVGSKGKPKPQQAETTVEGGVKVSVEKKGGLRGTK